VSVGGELFRQRVARSNARARVPAIAKSHTYELRRTGNGWLLLVDNRMVKHCATLPEANLALIAVRSAHSGAPSVGKRSSAY
jgi:hypothetical protein